MIAKYNGHSYPIANDADLESVLSTRDSCGGAEFWLTHTSQDYPCLVIIYSGTYSHVTYLPEDGHAGHRALGGLDDLPQGGFTTFVWDGADPGSGEDTPNDFVLKLETAFSIAQEFFHTKAMMKSIEWFEL